jgi:hypothetical protein
MFMLCHHITWEPSDWIYSLFIRQSKMLILTNLFGLNIRFSCTGLTYKQFFCWLFNDAQYKIYILSITELLINVELLVRRELAGEIGLLEKETAPMSLYPSHLTWNRTRTAGIRSRRLTAWTMAHSLPLYTRMRNATVIMNDNVEASRRIRPYLYRSKMFLVPLTTTWFHKPPKKNLGRHTDSKLIS